MYLLFMTLGCNTNDKTDTATTPNIEYTSCDTPLPVLEWMTNAVPIEGIEGIEDELASVDLNNLEDPVDISGLIPMFRGIIAYALEIAPADLPDSLSHAQALEAGTLGEVVLASLLLGKEDPTGIDFSFFRRGFHRYYTCSRAFPSTIEGFQQVYGTYNADNGTVVDSIAKCGDRRLISVSSDVYIAESMTEGYVRETEILLQNTRRDGQLDFLVYNKDGLLTNRTQFPTVGNGPHVVTSAPYSCMTCHMNPESAENAWGYDILLPSTGPCR